MFNLSHFMTTQSLRVC